MLIERLAAGEKVDDLEKWLVADLCLAMQLSDLIAPPIIEEKLRSFLVGSEHGGLAGPGD